MRHHAAEFRCPLLGVKRTLLGGAPMSAFDPKRTWAVQSLCSANRPLTPISPVAGAYRLSSESQALAIAVQSSGGGARGFHFVVGGFVGVSYTNVVSRFLTCCSANASQALAMASMIRL